MLCTPFLVRKFLNGGLPPHFERASVDEHYKEIRIMYAGTKNYIHQVLQDFIKFGVKIPEKERPFSIVVQGNLLKQFAPTLRSFPNIKINFYSDVYELAKILPSFDADIIIIDERIEIDSFSKVEDANEGNTLDDSDLNPDKVLHFSHTKHDTHAPQEIKFENLKSAIEKFTPRNFIYTMRRVMVVLPQQARKTDREFILGIEQVRGVIVEPSSTVDLFLYAAQGRHKFYQNHKKTSLCFSGGGLEGYLYSVGVAHALDQCFTNKKNCCDFDIFYGVSSGSLISSALAAQIRSDLLVRQINRQGNELAYFGLNTIFDFATSEIVRKGMRLLKAFTTHDLGEAISRFQDAIPVGFFKGERLKNFVENQMERVGVENNIAALKRELYIGVTDQDTGDNIILGEEPWRDIKISQAVRASTALPPFYLPEKINGHWFSDGQITAGANFNHSIHKGAGLIVNVDPMVAYTSNMPGAIMKRGGYFTLLQSVKAVVQSRAESVLRHSMDKNPDVDFINFHPTDEGMEAMAGNPMKYHLRTELVDLGFKCTISQVLSSYESMVHKFSKHGFYLKTYEEISEF